VGYVGKSQVGTTAQADGMLIKDVNVTIPRPVAGQNPASSCTVETAACTLYHTDPVTWTDEAGKIVKATDKFQEGKRYTVSIWLSAKSGYQFATDASGKPKLTGAINGDLPPYINKAYEQDPKQVIELTYTFGSTPAAPETPDPTEPTATTPVTPSHTHTPSSWRSTGAYHYRACTSCGDFLDQEDHVGGKATCTEAGTCTVCGYAYLPITEDHTPDTSKWTACGNLYHAHLCKACGAHCDAQDHVPGPEATETAPQKCTVCDFIIVPAKNHTHELKLVAEVAPGCATIGSSAYYACSGCSQRFWDAEGKQAIAEDKDLTIPAQGHKLSNSYGFDGQNHWYTCAVCQEAMVDTKAAHDTKAGKCVCGYDSAAASQDTQPDPQQTPQEKPQPKRLSWLTAVLLSAGSMGIAVVITMIILKSKRKKEN